MVLKRNVKHDWESARNSQYDLECSRCGQPWSRSYPSDTPPEKWCVGMKQGRPNKVSKKKKRKRTDDKGHKHTYGPYWKWASKQPCIVCGTVDGAPADHLKTVGAGGRDKANCIPVCANHQGRHNMGIHTWAEEYGFTKKELEIKALELWEEYRNAHDPKT